MEMLLNIVAGVILGPIMTAILKRFTWVDEQLGAAINLAVVLALYLACWYFVTAADRSRLEEFVLWALAASGVGGAANNIWRKKLAPDAPLP